MHTYDQKTRMPFGKHRGQLLRDLPTDYLAWLGTISLTPGLAHDVDNELRRRAELAIKVEDAEVLDLAGVKLKDNVRRAVQSWYVDMLRRCKGCGPRKVLRVAHKLLRRELGL